MAQHLKHNVRSQSARSGVPVNLIVLHTTEGHNRPGVSDLTGLASYFDTAEASAHVANDAEGNDIRMVPDDRKAWTCAAFNSASLNIEQVGFASTSKEAWFKTSHPQLVNSAKWIAQWSRKYGIPIRHGAVSGESVTRSGVVAHADLGAPGGGHHDPGSGYPLTYVLWMARVFATQPGSWKHKRAVRKVNRIRKHFGIHQLGKE